jgi:hypothetical protein
MYLNEEAKDLSLFFSLSLYFFLSLAPSLSFCLSLRLSCSLSISPSLSLSLSLSHFVLLSASMSVGVYLLVARVFGLAVEQINIEVLIYTDLHATNMSNSMNDRSDKTMLVFLRTHACT